MRNPSTPIRPPQARGKQAQDKRLKVRKTVKVNDPTSPRLRRASPIPVRYGAGKIQKKRKMVTVNDKMQKGYRYILTEPVGRNFHPDFKPELTPKQMLALGVFGGVYMRDCTKEFPKDWFAKAKFQKEGVYVHAPGINLFKVNASQPLSVWRKKGWINEEYDPRGWFQWYCRYYMGRRLPGEDERQIKRWIAIRRHISQIKKNCPSTRFIPSAVEGLRTGRRPDLTCRPTQRQAVLHWAYDSRKM